MRRTLGIHAGQAIRGARRLRGEDARGRLPREIPHAHREPLDSGVGLRIRGTHGINHEVRARIVHASCKQRRDIGTRAQHGRDAQVHAGELRGFRRNRGHVHAGVVALSKEQGHDRCLRLAGQGEREGGIGKRGRGEVQVRGAGDLTGELFGSPGELLYCTGRSRVPRTVG